MTMALLKDNGIHNYWPEMGQATPDGCIFEARLSYYGTHWYLTSLNGQTLKGRGIVDEGDGRYKATPRAFEKICKEYPVRHENFLD